MLALLHQLDAACQAAKDLAQAVEVLFPQHPDAEILLSFPGLGTQLAARVLAEVGDDHTRFADARGLKAYAGAAPVTRASGKKSHIGFYAWSRTTASTTSATSGRSPPSPPHPAAGTHYRARREHGDWHAAAQRHLFNRLLGQLHHCLQHHERFDENTAFPAPALTEVAA